MPIVKQIPKRSNFFQPHAQFTGVFNAPAVGKYDFGTAANRGVVFMELAKGSIYLLDKITFAATIAEGDYLLAIENTPQLLFRYEKDTHPVFQKPLPMVNYIDGQETVAYVETTIGAKRDSDKLVGDFSGLLDQHANLVGVSEIVADVQLNIYEVYDQGWVSRWRDGTLEGTWLQ
jgi:hypothetical protein